MSKIFFTADTHYGHANIAGKNVSKWKDGYRDFKSVDDMNQELVKQINKHVGVEDTLYHLGDWSFGGIENIWKFRKQIICQDIHLILGNHDHHIEENKILDIDNGMTSFAKTLFSSVSHYKELKTTAGIIVLSHYGHRVWHGSHKGWIHLYGHSHGSLPMLGKSMDIGVDSAKMLLGEYRPFYLSEIINIMSNRAIYFPDHHESSTNVGKVR